MTKKVRNEDVQTKVRALSKITDIGTEMRK